MVLAMNKIHSKVRTVGFLTCLVLAPFLGFNRAWFVAMAFAFALLFILKWRERQTERMEPPDFGAPEPFDEPGVAS